MRDLRIGEIDERERMNLTELLADSNVFSVGVSLRTKHSGWTCLKRDGNYNAVGTSPYNDGKFTKTGLGALIERVARNSAKGVVGWKLHVSFADKTGEFKGQPAGSIKQIVDTKTELLKLMCEVRNTGTFANRKFPYPRSERRRRMGEPKLEAKSKSDEMLKPDGTTRCKLQVHFWTQYEMARHAEMSAKLEREVQEDEREYLEGRYGAISRRTGISVEKLAIAEDARMAHYGPIAQGSMLAGTS